MMQGETILCIAPRPWDSLWRESQQIMSRIAKHNRVFYFEPGRDYAKSHLAEMWRNCPTFFSLRARKLHDNLMVISTPSNLPTLRQHLPRPMLQVTVPLVNRINARILIRHIRWAIKAFGVKEPILWLNEVRPELLGQFGEKLACYFNYDEFADFVHNVSVKELVRQADDRLTKQADVVFATSRAQWRRRKAINPYTYFIPNGVDFDMFNRTLQPGLPLPADIATVPRPVIGFAGWLGYHIDVELLGKVAEAYPNCSLVLVGPDELPHAGRQQLQALPNVFFLGRKERQELANYLQVFNVALMPWILSSGHVRHAYPLKLHEYLAAGRSIVAVALPELEPYRHVLRIAETPDEFIRHIGEALPDNAPEVVEARVAVARENTWDHRVAEIYRALQHQLLIKTSGDQVEPNDELKNAIRLVR
jgi:hypothetical protein